MTVLSQGEWPRGALVMIIITGLVLYFIPAFVATTRRMPNAGAITVINLFAGWTLVGWVGALVMACWPKPQPVVHQTIYAAQAPALTAPAGPQHAEPIFDHIRQAFVYQDPVTNAWLVQNSDGTWSPIAMTVPPVPALSTLPPPLHG